MEKRINKWVENNLISGEQAKLLLQDYEQEKEHKRQLKIQISLYSIGALLVGLGVILFIAANNWIWEIFLRTNLLKVLCLSVLTVGIYFSGYYIKYEKKNFPRLGSALIFLSTLFIGGTYALIGQIYNINAGSSALILVWLLSILPLAFIHKSNSINILSIVLFLIWVPLFYYSNNSHNHYTPTLIPLLTSLFLYSFGNIPAIKLKLNNFSMAYKIFGLIILFFVLFILTFFREFAVSTYSLIFYIPMALITMANLAFLKFEKQKDRLFYIETGIMIGLILIFLLLQGSTLGYWAIKLASNGLYIALLWLGFKYGYAFEDFKLINLSSFFLIIYITARYFEYSWQYLDKSVFFILGGAILLGIGYFLEKKKKMIRSEKRG